MRLLIHPGGICLTILVWLLMVFSNYVVFKHVFLDGFWRINALSGFFRNAVLFAVIFYEVVLCFAWVSHVIAVFSDAGSTQFAPWESPDLKLFPVTCEKCGGRWKPPRAHHCRSCQQCIFRMDHHCPWINNCVGLGNQKCFILFLVYTGVACFVNLCFLCAALYAFIFFPDYLVSLIGTVFMISDFAICSFFLYMTTEFFLEQWEALETNSTLIENYRRQRGKQADLWEYLEDVFGRQWLLWCIPLPAKLNPQYTELVYPEDGFEASQNVTQCAVKESFKPLNKDSSASALRHDPMGGLIAPTKDKIIEDVTRMTAASKERASRSEFRRTKNKPQ